MNDQARRTKRYPASQALELRCETWQDFVQHYATDISQGGLFVVTEEKVPLESVIELRLDLPEGHSVPLRGRVVHVLDGAEAQAQGREPGLGVEFVDLDDARKAHIQQLVDFARWEGVPGSSTFAAHMFEQAASHQTLTEIVQSLPPPAAPATSEPAAPHGASGHPSGQPRRRKKRRTLGGSRATGEFETDGRPKKRRPPKPTDRLKLKEAMVHFAHKRYREAIEDLRKMDEENPGDVEANKWLLISEARLALADGQEEDAVRFYEKVLRYDENNHEARKFVRTFHRNRKLQAIPFGRLFVKRNTQS